MIFGLLKKPILTSLSLLALATFIVGLQKPGTALAAEGGSSLYLPGVAGDVLIALSPAPGLQVSDMVFVQSGNVSTTVLQGKIDVGVDLDVVLNLVGASYTFEKKILGGTYTIGAAIPFGYAKLDARATGPFGGGAGLSADKFDLADIALVPFQLNWNFGNVHLKVAETIIVPTGGYNTVDTVNLGRNYWASDTNFAFTWFDQENGRDISVVSGLMVNSRNKATDYKTGMEFHADFTANQFLSSTFAIGLRGYYYKQLTGDSGSGAILGDFKSESLGLGPGVVWIPASGGGKLTIFAKAMFDVMAKNRFKSNYFTVAAAWKF